MNRRSFFQAIAGAAVLPAVVPARPITATAALMQQLDKARPAMYRAWISDDRWAIARERDEMTRSWTVYARRRYWDKDGIRSKVGFGYRLTDQSIAEYPNRPRRVHRDMLQAMENFDRQLAEDREPRHPIDFLREKS